MDGYCIYFKLNGKVVAYKDLDVWIVESHLANEWMRQDKVSTIEALSDNDEIYFSSEEEAFKYLEAFKRAYKLLLNGDYCLDRELPCLFFARHNLVQIIAGLKTTTSRKKLYGRMGRIKKNEFFNASDRTYFVTCRARDFVYGKNELQLAFSFMAG